MTVSAFDRIKAQAMASTIGVLLGSTPNVIDKGEYLLIQPSQAQADQLRAMLEAWLNKDPGAVRVDVSQIIDPLIKKKAAPWLVGAAAVGGLLGKFAG